PTSNVRVALAAPSSRYTVVATDAVASPVFVTVSVCVGSATGAGKPGQNQARELAPVVSTAAAFSAGGSSRAGFVVALPLIAATTSATTSTTTIGRRRTVRDVGVARLM